VRRGRPAVLLMALLVLAPALAACASWPDGSSEQRFGSDITGPGEGTFTFAGYPPLAERPVRVWYLAPDDEPQKADVLVVIPGVNRNAEQYRQDWVEEARERHLLVLVPELSDDDFPGASAYNLGNVVDEDGDVNDSAEWTFQLVEALFDHVVDDLAVEASTYALFGHSAGAQFVHRFVQFMPKHRARVAVAANAGWYTMLDDSEDFPYGLAGSPAEEDEMAPALASNLVILLGADDNDANDENLRRNDDVDEQGKTRLDRGLTFYRQARAVAADQEVPFAWQLTVIPGIGHSHSGMAKAAVPLVFPAQPLPSGTSSS
jgi:alpha-beta hydrolase superfamily lysophospholipase